MEETTKREMNAYCKKNSKFKKHLKPPKTDPRTNNVYSGTINDYCQQDPKFKKDLTTSPRSFPKSFALRKSRPEKFALYQSQHRTIKPKKALGF